MALSKNKSRISLLFIVSNPYKFWVLHLHLSAFIFLLLSILKHSAIFQFLNLFGHSLLATFFSKRLWLACFRIISIWKLTFHKLLISLSMYYWLEFVPDHTGNHCRMEIIFVFEGDSVEARLDLRKCLLFFEILIDVSCYWTVVFFTLEFAVEESGIVAVGIFFVRCICILVFSVCF